MEALFPMFIVGAIIGVYDERLPSLLVGVGHYLLVECGVGCISYYLNGLFSTNSSVSLYKSSNLERNVVCQHRFLIKKLNQSTVIQAYFDLELDFPIFSKNTTKADLDNVRNL